MVRQWKEMGFRGGGGSYGEELGRLVFVLWAAVVTLSLLAAIVFFCADGMPKDTNKASADNNYGHGSTCTAACGAGCGGGCGG